MKRSCCHPENLTLYRSSPDRKIQVVGASCFRYSRGSARSLDQGVVGYIFSTPQHSTIPLYRAYQSNHFDHFYPTNLAERDLAVRGLGYVTQGVAGYIYPDDLCGPRPLPLYRSFSQVLWGHSFTMSEVEKEDSVAEGYYEGVQGYSVLS